MGVIYSTQEVARNETPKIGNHLRAAHLVTQRIPRLAGIALTIVHGSVAEERFSDRSDLDVVITYEVDHPTQEIVVVNDIKSTLDEINKETHVKIEPNIWPADEPLGARTERMYDRLFANHLAESMINAQWSIGKSDSMISRISAMPVDIHKILNNYLTYKHNGVTKAPINFDSRDPFSLLAMQRILELPKALGRKVAQSHGILHPEATGDFKDILDNADISDHFHESIIGLREIDQGYSTLLKDYLSRNGSFSEGDLSEYESWLFENYSKSLSLGIVAVSSFTRFLPDSSLL